MVEDWKAGGTDKEVQTVSSRPDWTRRTTWMTTVECWMAGRNARTWAPDAE